RRQTRLQFSCLGRVRHHSEHRPVLLTLRLQHSHAAVPGQSENTVAVNVPGQHIQSADADRAGCTQHCNPFVTQPSRLPNRYQPREKTGTAAVRLSMRSITPPCPGNRLLLSFRPCSRLNRLSVRSPTTENRTTTRVPTIPIRIDCMDQPR